MPMKIGVYFFLAKVGRKPGQAGTLLLTALCLFINMFAAKGHFWLLLNLCFTSFNPVVENLLGQTFLPR